MTIRKVLHILDHSTPMHSGYTFRTLSILRQQRKLGWSTAHLTGWKHTATALPEETIDGLHFYRTPLPTSGAGRKRLFGELALMHALARRLAEVIDREKPDILHAHSPVLNALPALWVGWRKGIPVVYEIRAFWEDASVSHGTSAAGGAVYRLTRALETFAMRCADAVTTICEGLRADIIARGIPAGKVTVIPNAVDDTEFVPTMGRKDALAARLGLSNCFVLGFLGSFYSYEGLHLLLQAVPLMNPTIRVLLVGGGPEEAALRAQAQALKIDDRVVFAGRVPHDEVQSYYSLVNLLVFPRISIRLTELVTPLKPLEAMAQHHLVIASNVGGHRELIRDGVTGFLFQPDDPKALADGVQRAMARTDRWDMIRANARRYIETERNWTASVARYRHVYNSVLA